MGRTRAANKLKAVMMEVPTPPQTETGLTSDQYTELKNHWVNRKFYLERTFKLEDFAQVDWCRKIVKNKWTEVMKMGGEANLNIVREFYACMDIIGEGASCQIKFRGTNFEFKPSVIAKFLKLPNRRVKFKFNKFKDRANETHWPSWVDVVNFLCLDGVRENPPRSKLEYSELKPEFTALAHLVTHNVLPLNHRTTMRKKIGYMMYMIAHGASMCMASTIYWDIVEAKQTMVASDCIPFGVLITKICLDRGVKASLGDETDKSITPMDKTFWARSSSKKKKRSSEESNDGQISKKKKRTNQEGPSNQGNDEETADVDEEGGVHMNMETRMESIFNTLMARLDVIEENQRRSDVRLEELFKQWNEGIGPKPAPIGTEE